MMINKLLSSQRYCRWLIQGFILVIVVALIGGCSERKQANKENFKNIVADKLQQDDESSNYIPVKLGPYHGLRVHPGPVVEVLADQNYLQSSQVKPSKISHYRIAGYHQIYIPTIMFKPTKKGQSYFKKRCGFLGFCMMTVRVGEAKMVDIQKFTPPKTKDGITSSTVNYTYYIKPYPWLDTVLSKPQIERVHFNVSDLRKQLGSEDKPLTASIKLYRKKDGWTATQPDSAQAEKKDDTNKAEETGK